MTRPGSDPAYPVRAETKGASMDGLAVSRSVGRHVRPWLALAALAALLHAAGPAAAAEKLKSSFTSAGNTTIGLLLATSRGYYAQEGLDVEIVTAPGGVATPALMSGDIDFS